MDRNALDPATCAVTSQRRSGVRASQQEARDVEAGEEQDQPDDAHHAGGDWPDGAPLRAAVGKRSESRTSPAIRPPSTLDWK